MKLIQEILSLKEENRGSNYAEQLAHQIFGLNPNMDTAGHADKLLKYAYGVAQKELGAARTKGVFRDDDFLGDFVTTYHALQKQGVTDGTGDPEEVKEGFSEDDLAEKTDGKLIKVDQAGRVIKEMQEAHELDLDPNKRVVIKGVRGMQSKPFSKKFKDMAAYEVWCDSEEAEDCDVQQVMNEEGDYSPMAAFASHREEANAHLSSAMDADASGKEHDYHAHMTNYHESMSQHEAELGREDEADYHERRADYHDSKSFNMRHEQ